MAYVLLAANGNATRGPIKGRHVSLVYLLKPLHSAGVDPVTSGQGKALGKAAQPARPCMFLVIYVPNIIFNIVIMCIWAWGRAGAKPRPMVMCCIVCDQRYGGYHRNHIL
jgi:hypothetical protein